MKTKSEIHDLNADPFTDQPGAHPVGAGVGALAGGAIAGAAVGSVAGPIGAVIGATVGAIAGGLAGHSVAEIVHPSSDGAASVAGDDSEEPDVTTPSPVSSDPEQPTVRTTEVLAVAAYYIWERKGRTDGHALNDWLEAEAKLRPSHPRYVAA